MKQKQLCAFPEDGPGAAAGLRTQLIRISWALRVALCGMVPLVFCVLFCMGSAALLGTVTNLKKTKV